MNDYIPFWQYEQKLAPDFCANLMETYFKPDEKQQAPVMSDNPYDETVRKTHACWIPPLEQISQIMLNHALIANYKAGWNADIEYIEPVQFGEYAEGGHYEWHADTPVLSGNMHARCRKLTVVVMLTPPEEYEGGELLIGFPKHQTAPNSQGTIIVFPSPTLHKVTPVTKGKRYTLVGWCSGPTWK